MSDALALAGLALVHLMAAASPGPASVAVTRVAVAQSRRAAVATGLGVASAGIFWAVAAALGMHVLLVRFPWLDSGLKLAGGLYLAWLGIKSWRHARAPLTTTVPAGTAMDSLAAWRLGASINLANPKAIVFFGSIFVTLLAPDAPLWLRLAALGIVAVNETGWFLLVALLFSSGPAQAVYRRAKTWIDRAAGSVMMLFGVRLMMAARF